VDLGDLLEGLFDARLGVHGLPAQRVLAPGIAGEERAARLLGVSRRSVQYMLEDGRLEGTRIPPRGWWRISRASLARLIPLDSVQ